MPLEPERTLAIRARRVRHNHAAALGVNGHVGLDVSTVAEVGEDSAGVGISHHSESMSGPTGGTACGKRGLGGTIYGVNTLTALAVLVACITPLATMWGVNRQLRAQAARDAILHDTQRLDEREARLRGAYAKVLRAADHVQSAMYELGWYPKGRPWESEVSHPTYTNPVTAATLGGVSGNQTVYHELGDYSRVNTLVEKAQILMSEATIDIGMEHDSDRCLDYYTDTLYPQFHAVQTAAVTDGIVKDLPKDVAAFSDGIAELTQLARESLRALVMAPQPQRTR